MDKAADRYDLPHARILDAGWAAERSEQPMVEREGRRTAWGSPYPPFP
jgi:hypothetical protein